MLALQKHKAIWKTTRNNLKVLLSNIANTARFYLGYDDKQLKQAVSKHPLNI